MSDSEGFGSLDAATPGGYMQGGVIDPWNSTIQNGVPHYDYLYGGKKKKTTKKPKTKKSKTTKKKTTKPKKKVVKKKKPIAGGAKRKPAARRPKTKKVIKKKVVGGAKKTTKKPKTVVSMPKSMGGKKTKSAGASKKKSYEFDFHGKKTVIQASGSGRAADKIAAKMLKSNKKTEGTVTVSFIQLSEGRDQNKPFKFSVKRTAKTVKSSLPGKKTMRVYKYDKTKL